MSGGPRPELAKSLYALGAILLVRGKATEAENAVRESLEIRRKIFGGVHPYVAQSLCGLARVLILRGHYAEAESVVADALAIQRKVLGHEHAAVAESLRILANSRIYGTNRNAAKEAANEALAIERKLHGDSDLSVADTLALLGRILGILGDPRAESVGREALAMRRNLNDPWLAWSLAEMIQILRVKGRWLEAIGLAKERIRLLQDLVGPDDRVTLNAAVALGEMYFFSGDYVSALPLTQKTAKRFTEKFGRKDFDSASAKLLLARILKACRKFDESIDLFREAIEIMESERGEGSMLIHTARFVLGYAFLESGRVSEAEEIFVKDIEIARKRAGAKLPGLVTSQAGLAEVYNKQGKFLDAEVLLRRYVEDMRSDFAGDWVFFRTQSILGEALLGQGRFAEAEVVLSSAFDGAQKLEAQIISSWDYYLPMVERMHRLYALWEKPTEAALWRSKLDELTRRAPAQKFPESYD